MTAGAIQMVGKTTVVGQVSARAIIQRYFFKTASAFYRILIVSCICLVVCAINLLVA